MRRAGAIRAVIVGTVFTGLAAVGSQGPEVFDCFDSEGASRTEFRGGDVQVPHCDDEFMSESGLATHNGLKDITIVLGVITLSLAAAVKVGDYIDMVAEPIGEQ